MKITKEFMEKLESITNSIHVNGKEYCNPIPTHIPVEGERPLTLKEQVQRLFKNELSAMAESQEYETFEESQDFEIPDEFEIPLSKYQKMLEEHPIEEISGEKQVLTGQNGTVDTSPSSDVTEQGVQEKDVSPE